MRIQTKIFIIAFIVIQLFGFYPSSLMTEAAGLPTTLLHFNHNTGGTLNWKYVGSFHFPPGQAPFDSTQYVGAQPGNSLAYNPANNSLFIVSNQADGSHNYRPSIAEWSIPAGFSSSNNPDAIPYSTQLQGFIDPTDGAWSGRNFLCDDPDPSKPNNCGAVYIGGVMVAGNRLYFNGYVYYDANGIAQTRVWMSRSTNLSAPGTFIGPLPATSPDVDGIQMVPGHYVGNVMPVTSQWQSALGCSYISGYMGMSIVSRTSKGPSAFCLNTNDIDSGSTVRMTPLLDYPGGHTGQGHIMSAGPAQGLGWCSTNQSDGNCTSDFWNQTSSGRSLISVKDTNTLIVIGTHGFGPQNYCNMTGDWSLVQSGTVSDDGNPFCYNPEGGSTHGPTAFPYRIQYWLFRMSDLAAVHAGGMNPYDPRPYEYGTFNLGTSSNPWTTYTQDPYMGSTCAGPLPNGTGMGSALLTPQTGTFTGAACAGQAWMGTNGGHIAGATYDESRQRLYIIHSFVDGNSAQPIIHVYDLCGFTGTPNCSDIVVAPALPPPSTGPSIPLAPPGGNNAQFISQSVLSTMSAGQTYSVSITYKNIGTSTWTVNSDFKLGSRNPFDNTTWGVNRVNIPSNTLPGNQVTVTFNVTAPNTPGIYNFQFGLLKELIEWFGDLTPNISVNVTIAATLRGDLNNDGIVNSLDWSIMNSKWFTADPIADLNSDGLVNAVDCSILNADWFKRG